MTTTTRVISVAAAILAVAGLIAVLFTRQEPKRKRASAEAPSAVASAAQTTFEDTSEPVKLPQEAKTWAASEAAWQAVGFVESALARAITDAKRFPELAQCLSSKPRSECADLEYEAVRKSMSWPVGPRLAVGKDLPIRELIARHGAGALASETRRTTEDVLLKSASPARRVAALALDERLAAESGEPPPAYDDGLSERPRAEVYYLARTLEQQPSKSDVVTDELSKLASDYRVAPEVRRQAIRSLGAAGDGAPMENVIDKMLANSTLSERTMAESVGPALARCGDACGAYVTRLAQGENPMGRLAALMTATHAPAEVRERLLALIAPRATTGAERDQLAFLTRPAKKNAQ
jgi:hypothetical protein